jgi:hypothetical protein
VLLSYAEGPLTVRWTDGLPVAGGFTSAHKS